VSAADPAPSLAEAIADAFFHDERLWFGFTEQYQRSGGVTEARRMAAIVAAETAEELITADRPDRPAAPAKQVPTTYRYYIAYAISGAAAGFGSCYMDLPGPEPTEQDVDAIRVALTPRLRPGCGLVVLTIQRLADRS
jgi:hypothetical protein